MEVGLVDAVGKVRVGRTVEAAVFLATFGQPGTEPEHRRAWLLVFLLGRPGTEQAAGDRDRVRSVGGAVGQRGAAGGRPLARLAHFLRGAAGGGGLRHSPGLRREMSKVCKYNITKNLLIHKML